MQWKIAGSIVRRNMPAALASDLLDCARTRRELTHKFNSDVCASKPRSGGM
jgi:hypothetical protein